MNHAICGNNYFLLTIKWIFAIVFFPFALSAQVPKTGQDPFTFYRNIGYDFEDHNQLDSAFQYYRQALEVAQLAQDKYNLATIYTDLAIIYRKKADYVACKNYHSMSLEMAEKSGDNEMIEGNLHGIGSLFEQVGDYDKAVEYYLKTLALTQQRGDQEGVIVTLQNISKTYMQLKIKDLALNNIEQARSLAAGIHNDSLMANVLHDFGEILINFGENERALEKLKAALNTYERLGYERYIASSLVYIGDVYSKMGRPDLTLSFFNRALEYRDEMDSYVLSDMFYKTGNLYLQKNKTAEAKKNFEASLQIAAENEYRDLHQKDALKLYELAKKYGDAQSALAWLQKSTELKDSIFDVEKTKRIAEMQLKFDNEKQQRVLQTLELRQYQSVLVSAIIIFGLIIGFLAYIARVGDRNNRLLEGKNREIQHQNIQLSESNEVLRQYAYVAAHDLKEPLRTICSFINLLEIRFGKKLEDPQALQYMQLISDSAKRMNVLLTDLLEYSSIFHQKPGSDNVNPKNVLDEVCINLRNLVDSKQATVEYGEHFPHLAMNRVHLMQIFQNLVGNALKFTNERRPYVQVSWKIEGKDIVFAVRDNGIGIGERHREKIFNLFFRAHEGKDYEGTGIGLSICKSLTEKYGGRIWFQSVEGQGTTFYFSFPKDIVAREENTSVERKSKVA